MLDQRVVPRFLSLQHHEPECILAPICTLGFLELVIYMPLIIPTLTGLMSTLLKWVPIMVEVIHTSRYRLVPCLDTLIRVLAIMSVVNRRHYATPCRIQDIKTRETLLKGHIRDGLYHFSALARLRSLLTRSFKIRLWTVLCLLCGTIVLATRLFLLLRMFYKNVILL
ncbi:hypothetical protein ES332_A04G106000v1 [Gossypium tomentosum]|uniref:Uncharacterized protein n=1 Tax=Gossypium tomentosum TaxID=34277 RepID=A0A5D2R0C6_GOSTO|nr:hypothetical protein ES332_A04G106000v1 [Gossypium tomentosum]